MGHVYLYMIMDKYMYAFLDYPLGLGVATKRGTSRYVT